MPKKNLRGFCAVYEAFPAVKMMIFLHNSDYVTD